MWHIIYDFATSLAGWKSWVVSWNSELIFITICFHKCLVISYYRRYIQFFRFLIKKRTITKLIRIFYYILRGLSISFRDISYTFLHAILLILSKNFRRIIFDPTTATSGVRCLFLTYGNKKKPVGAKSGLSDVLDTQKWNCLNRCMKARIVSLKIND